MANAIIIDGGTPSPHLKNINKPQLIELCLHVWKKEWPDEFRAYLKHVEGLRKGLKRDGNTSLGKFMGAPPTRPYMMIQKLVPDFWADPKNLEAFYSVFSKAKVR